MPDETALFTTAEARAFKHAGTAVLANETTYPTATITAKELEIREFFLRTCAVDFFPTTHTDEYHSGDGSQYLALSWPRVTSVAAASTRSDATWTALTVAELADIHIDPDREGYLYREGSYWPSGVRNIKVTYAAGYTAVPKPVKDAALWICVTELAGTNISPAAESYDGGGESYSFAMGDGYNDSWHRLPVVRRAIRMYSHRIPGIA